MYDRSGNIGDIIEQVYLEGKKQSNLDLLKTIESECACPFCDNTGKVWNNKKEKMVECGDSCIYLKLQLLRDKLKKGE